MPSIQSTLGDEEGVAEELAESQRQISIAEFFEKNKHMLGFDSGARALVTAVKEAVDNALDATEEAGEKPDISVRIDDAGDYYTLVIEDNGPGITKEEVPKVFGKLLYGSRFHSREQSLTPDQRLLVRRNGEVDFVPIGMLCDAYLPQDGAGTAPIPDEIEVPSFTRDSHEMSWESVTHAIRHETDERTYEITTEKGRTVEVTGNHSLFSVTKDGDTREVNAGELAAGETILAPRRLPGFDETTSEVNLLNHLTADQLEDRRVYVYGFDEETLADIRSGETVRRKPSEDSGRKRYYYRYDGVEILRDSLEQNYIEKGYLPAEKVLELGWEDRAADCEFKTYQVGGETTTIPVTVELSESFMELVAYYISEGHADDRQIGLTFGSHESTLVEATERAVAGVGGSTTTVERERNSTRVKAFGSPLAMFLKNRCGDAASNKRVPEFVFEADPERQRQFIAALYQGDGSDSYPGNELSHTTTSETLARQLSVLWNMQGVLASTEVVENASGYADDSATTYRTKVYGEDVTLGDVFETQTRPGEQQYKRIPVSLLDDVRVEDTSRETVPDTVPGLLLGAGVGSDIDHAEVYRSLIEDAIAGEYVEKPRYVHNLREMGLLDDDHRPTEELTALWETVQNLHGLTDSDMCLLRVENVEATDPPEYVYDISVPGATGADENFVVANDGALSVKNSRGQQGIGISAAVLYSQLTSGKPAKVTSKTESGSERYLELVIDTDENEPEIKDESDSPPPGKHVNHTHGTRIELEMEANMRARSQLLQYVKHTAVVNPHARITFQEPSMDEPRQFERADGAELPAETEEIRPHPHGVELGTVLKMLAATDSHSVSGFVQEEFTRVGRKTADSILDEFRDRHVGREAAWTPPQSHEQSDLARAVADAVANKGKDATAAFGDAVADAVCARDRLAHHELVGIVSEVAEEVGDDHDATFGDTVQENAVEAAWERLTDDRTSDLYALVDAATSTRKDDETVHGLAERLAKRFEKGRERDRATHATLVEYVDRAADQTEEYDDATVGDTARENVVMEVWNTMVTVPDDVPKVREFVDDRDAASDLLDAMKATDIIAPPTNCLSPITDDLVEAGLRKEYDADFYAASTRDAEVHGGDPFIVEAGIAYGGDLEAEGQAEVLRFANRVPLVYQRGACATTDVVKSIGWRNYNLDQPGGSGIPNGPAVIMVHVASTNVPFTSESKDAVANVPEIEDEIELAIREAARELKSYLNKRKSLQKRKKKQSVIASILPKMAEKLADVTDEGEPEYEDAMARIMNNVLVEREVEDGEVELVVENNSGSNADLEVTEIVFAEPSDLSDGAQAVPMDDEWFVKWEPTVGSGETETLTYRVEPDAEFAEANVDGIEAPKLTNNT
ncbi:DNA topoisomerase VI subunit B [Halorussus halobius]|uniref:DNA topoisomerase VI subunit B n=1 Tax=Halorussus halobius TaxID=1710537 RepID=UPI00109274E8|nr:DNA topoisomerase VI subunit B [Halorussus halobius]